MKKALIGVGSLLVIIIALLIFVWSSLDRIVKTAIETYGSDVTKTHVSVTDVKIALKSGEASISGLNVANIEGFADPSLFKLGMISTKIDTGTVTENPVVIKEIIIRTPEVFYEINSAGTSNIDLLKKNINQATAGGGDGASKDDSGEELKLIIRKLVIDGCKVKVRIAALGNKEQSVNIPRIQLTDIGKKSGGKTAAEVAIIISSTLVKHVKSAVTKIGVNKYLGKPADIFKKGVLPKQPGAVKGTADKIGGAVKGLLGN